MSKTFLLSLLPYAERKKLFDELYPAVVGHYPDSEVRLVNFVTPRGRPSQDQITTALKEGWDEILARYTLTGNTTFIVVLPDTNCEGHEEAEQYYAAVAKYTGLLPQILFAKPNSQGGYTLRKVE